MAQKSAANATKEALAKIRELKRKLAEAESDRNDPIAIVSTACRFPRKSDSPEAFWNSLIEKSDEVTELPEDRWDLDAYYDEDPDVPGKMYARKGTFLENIDQMDADFFGISPREATWIDPQQRLFLEVSWEALERAGWAAEGTGKSTGVFVGWMHNDYQNEASESLLDLNPYIATGSAGSFLCGRLSYYLGVRGPSLAIDTACSSSLVALHLACQSLRQGECDRALAGGVNIMVSPKTTIMTCKLHALSPSGHSRAFDASADGYLRGEGCGVVTLRRLSDAVRDGDPVLAVIRGSAITHNGFSSGLTAPNPEAQQEVIRQALRKAGVSPSEVEYLEAHGTGTELGDPIEMHAAAAVLGEGRDRGHPLRVGSVKTNLGHLEAAAGIAGVIKTVLALQHDVIPAHLHFETPNPHIDWDRLPVEIVREATKWRSEGARIAGVSAFGMSGTNAHLVLSEPPPEARAAENPAESASDSGAMLVLGARSEEAVRELAGRYRGWIEEHPEIALPDVCHTAATGRRHFDHRVAVVADSREEMVDRLARIAKGATADGAVTGQAKADPVVAWQFTGQGSQYLDMGRALYENEPVFRETLDFCSEELARHRSGSLTEIIFNDEEELARTYWTQPALFAMHLALADLFESRGVHPDVVLGHSLGQYAAAVVAGMLDREEGIRLIHERSRLTDSLPTGGAMAAVFANEEEVRKAIADWEGLSIAAFNGSHIVISGPEGELEEAIAFFEKEKVRATRLRTSHAFHSSLLDPILDEFESVADSIPFRPARIPLVCNVTGEAIAAGRVVDGAYWRRQLREAVQFEASIRGLATLGCDILLELGPRPFLTGMAAACWSGPREGLVPSLDRDRPADEATRECLARLHTLGVALDFDAVFGFDENRRRVSPPTYPFQRQRHWGPERPGASRASAGTRHPLLGEQRDLAGVPNETRFENVVRPDRQQWLADHRVFDDIVFPGAGFVEIALAATRGAGELRDIRFEIPLMVPGPVTIQTILRRESDEGAIEIHSTPGTGQGWMRNASASWDRQGSGEGAAGSLPEAKTSCVTPVDPKAFYEMFAGLGIQYGTEFQTIRELREGEGEVLARLELSGDHRGYSMPPMILDGALQSLAVGLLHDGDSSLFLPVSISRFHLFRPVTGPVWSHGTWNETEGDSRSADLTLYDDRGNRVALLEGLQVRAVSRTALRQMVGSSSERLLYHMTWREEPLPSPTERSGRWMVIGEDVSLVNTTAEALGGRDQSCLRVSLDDGFESKGEPSFDEETVTLCSTRPEHWASVFERHFDGEDAGPLNGIVWLTARDASRDQHDFDPDTYAHRHCAGILALFQSLRARRIESLDRGFQILTFDGTCVDGEESVDPDAAQFWGMGRVIGSEYPPLRCRLLDYHSDNDSLDRLIEVLLIESRESQIALRDRETFVPRLVSLSAPSGDEAVPIRKGSTYLVTGGLGMLGRRAGEWFAERGAEDIVLVSRRAPTESTRELIDRIEESGSRVHVMLADIGDRGSLEKLLERIDDELPPLRGVLHAAGILDDGLFVEQTWDRFEKVMTPKKSGARHLHELTMDRELDFFILYSSAASVLGSPGQANYATANAYLDGLAHYRRAKGLPALSINFGPWNEGMAASETVTKAVQLQGMTPLTAEEAHEAIERLFNVEAIQATMLDVDWGRMRMRFPVEAPPLLDELWPDLSAAAGGPAILIEKLREAEDEGESPREVLTAHVQNELQQVLSLAKPPEPDVPLAELGLDSLMAVEFATRIQQQVGSRYAIPPTLAFDYPTVSKLTEHLLALIDAAPEPVETIAVTSDEQDESIAIVGMGCRFPGADDPDAYWRILREGIDATREIPADRWDRDRFYSPSPEAGKMYTDRGGFLPDIAEFDAEFFGLSEQDAAWMDPQHRLLLETSWQAMEDAGILPERLPDRQVGVFMGIMSTDYAQIRERVDPGLLEGSQGAGMSHSAGVGRLSYLFGFEGPSIAVDTASSSSLVAVCQAVRSLLDGDCNMALAGGVNAILSPTNSILLCKGGVLSPDGRSKSFSAAADGFGRGEGCGVVALKRRGDAERDGDRILGLIRGTAIGHNGQSGGLTAPSGRSQQHMIRRALANADVLPAEVQYLEAHATGTELGDPIEVRAAADVYGQGREEGHELLIGSAKANLSHLEAAGGIAGLIKAILCMRHGRIPGQIHFDEPSPHIPWDRIRARVVAEEREWPDPSRPLAGVSALGMTGTNAHVIVEGLPCFAPAVESSSDGDGPKEHLLVLSARTGPALEALAGRFVERLETLPESEFAAFCASAARGRRALEARVSVVAATPAEAIEILSALPADSPDGFVSGAGTEEVGQMGWIFPASLSRELLSLTRGLWESEPVFRETFASCAETVSELTGAEEGAPSLSDRLYGSESGEDLPYAMAVPALFAVQMGIAKWFESRGVDPDLLLGAGVGQFAAACAAGMMDWEDGLRLAVRRGELGEASDAITDEARDEWEALADSFDNRPPARPILDGSTGKIVPVHKVFGGSYWREHLDAEPATAECGLSLQARQCRYLLEIGPSDGWGEELRAGLDEPLPERIETIASEVRPTRALRRALARLHVAGIAIDLVAVADGESSRKVSVPTYPFQRRRYWIEEGAPVRT